jgi:hypothetical protein
MEKAVKNVSQLLPTNNSEKTIYNETPLFQGIKSF